MVLRSWNQRDILPRKLGIHRLSATTVSKETIGRIIFGGTQCEGRRRLCRDATRKGGRAAEKFQLRDMEDWMNADVVGKFKTVSERTNFCDDGKGANKRLL